MAVSGDPLIGAVHEGCAEGQSCQEPKRKGPPKGASQFQDGVCAAEQPAASGEQAHFAHKFGGGKAELLADPGGLQRLKLKLFMAQRGAEKPREGVAKATLTIVKNPAGPAPIGFYCLYCIHRNHRLKKI
jgi:hypothetical protein